MRAYVIVAVSQQGEQEAVREARRIAQEHGCVLVAVAVISSKFDAFVVDSGLLITVDVPDEGVLSKFDHDLLMSMSVAMTTAYVVQGEIPLEDNEQVVAASEAS